MGLGVIITAEEVNRRVGDVIELLDAGDDEPGARLFVETVARRPGAWEEELTAELREVFIGNAPTFLDEARDPDSERLDLDQLQEFDRPVLLTKGTASPPLLIAIVDTIASALPDWEIATIEGADHAPHQTTAKQYVDLVRRFVEGLTSPSPIGAGAPGLGSRARAQGEAEWAALRVSADRPAGTGVDHRAAERADLLQRCVEISNGEVWQRDGVAGTGPALMHPHRRGVRVCLPSASLLGGAVIELRSEEAGPEPPRSLRVISWKLDDGKPRVHRWHDTGPAGQATFRRRRGGGALPIGEAGDARGCVLGVRIGVAGTKHEFRPY